MAERTIAQLAGFAPGSLENDPQARKAALGLSRQLQAQLSDPVSAATELVFSPYVAVAARIGVDLNVFERIASAKGPTTTEELAKTIGAEPVLITRILRLLAGVGLVGEVSQDSWTATPMTEAMAKPTVAAGHRFVWDLLITSAIKAPKYLRENNFNCPTEPTDGFVQYAYQTKFNIFELLNSMPSLLQDFNNFMGNTMGARKYWVDWFPIEQNLLEGFENDKALIVDVAGGQGHDMELFNSKYPNKGRLVLQDLKQGFEGTFNLTASIEKQEQDFFTPNKEKGARAYFLHHILHDWSEKYCLEILKHLHDAMTPGYSKLLIHDLILPDTGATPFQTIFDMTMMTFNGGMERSRTQWKGLLEKAGFEVVQFYVDDEDADGIVEAVRKL